MIVNNPYIILFHWGDGIWRVKMPQYRYLPPLTPREALRMALDSFDSAERVWGKGNVKLIDLNDSKLAVEQQ